MTFWRKVKERRKGRRASEQSSRSPRDAWTKDAQPASPSSKSSKTASRRGSSTMSATGNNSDSHSTQHRADHHQDTPAAASLFNGFRFPRRASGQQSRSPSRRASSFALSALSDNDGVLADEHSTRSSPKLRFADLPASLPSSPAITPLNSPRSSVSAAKSHHITTRDLFAFASLTHLGHSLPINRYPSSSTSGQNLAQQQVTRLFRAVGVEDISTLRSIITSGLVSPNVLSLGGITPLVYAASRNLYRSTGTLLDLGAEIDLMSNAVFAALAPCEVASSTRITGRFCACHIQRTPLMAAARQGHLRIVKLLLEYGADDSLVAPDGQIALRLAQAMGHSDIVALLPSRRNGAARRLKIRLWLAVPHIVCALRLARFLGWTLPLFLLWTGWILVLVPFWKVNCQPTFERVCGRTVAFLIIFARGLDRIIEAVAGWRHWMVHHSPWLTNRGQPAMWRTLTSPVTACSQLPRMLCTEHSTVARRRAWDQVKTSPARIHSTLRRARQIVAEKAMDMTDHICSIIEETPARIDWTMCVAGEYLRCLPEALALMAGWCGIMFIFSTVLAVVMFGTLIALTRAAMARMRAVTFADVWIGLLAIAAVVLKATSIQLLRLRLFLRVWLSPPPSLPQS